MERETVKLGLIKGRHPLPVEKYILDESEISAFTKMELQPLIEKGLKKLEITEYRYFGYDCCEEWITLGKEGNCGKPPIVQLYITGLTIVTLTALDILNHWGYEVEIIGFNPKTQEYYSQGNFNNIFNNNY